MLLLVVGDRGQTGEKMRKRQTGWKRLTSLRLVGCTGCCACHLLPHPPNFLSACHLHLALETDPLPHPWGRGRADWPSPPLLPPRHAFPSTYHHLFSSLYYIRAPTLPAYLFPTSPACTYLPFPTPTYLLSLPGTRRVKAGDWQAWAGKKAWQAGDRQGSWA